jgi:hypothetical protein
MLGCGNMNFAHKVKLLRREAFLMTLFLFLLGCQDSKQDPAFCLSKGLTPTTDFLIENPQIAKAIQICELSETGLQVFYDEISKIQASGTPATSAPPLSFLEQEQDQYHFRISMNFFEEISAKRAAYHLWLEQEKLLPWSLLDYSDEELKNIFQNTSMARNHEKNEASVFALLDHSPLETWSVLKEILDWSQIQTQKDAIHQIIEASRRLRHGSISTDFIRVASIKETFESGISLRGCHSSSYYVTALAKAVNIPGFTLFGYYAGAGHRTAVFPTTDQVLSHGDDLYSRLLTNVPSKELLGSYEDWQTRVMIHQPFTPDGGRESLVYTYKKAYEYPSFFLVKRYCLYGRAGLIETFSDYFSEKEYDELEDRLQDLLPLCLE